MAKQYKLLKSIMATAVEDEMIPKNPCTIKGASVERSPERPVASIAEINRLVEVAEPRWKALILMATYTALRFGELAALTRRSLDLEQIHDLLSVHVAGAGEDENARSCLDQPGALDRSRWDLLVPRDDHEATQTDHWEPVLVLGPERHLGEGRVTGVNDVSVRPGEGSADREGVLVDEEPGGLVSHYAAVAASCVS